MSTEYPEQIYRHTTASAVRSWRERRGRYLRVFSACGYRKPDSQITKSDCHFQNQVPSRQRFSRFRRSCRQYLPARPPEVSGRNGRLVLFSTADPVLYG